jgi:hypothetical protein
VRSRYPDLAVGAGGEIGTYLADLRAWEADPEAYARDARLTERIDARFHEMILALVRAHSARAPVYVTQELVVADGTLSRALGARWQAVPHGLVFRLYADRAFHEPPPIALETRGLDDATRRFEADHVVMLKVRPVYTGMLVNRGLYYAVHGMPDRALEAASAALAVDPDDASARRLVAELQTR